MKSIVLPIILTFIVFVKICFIQKRPNVPMGCFFIVNPNITKKDSRSIRITQYHVNEPKFNPTRFVSTGEKVCDEYNVPKWIAISPDLKAIYPLKSTVHITVPNKPNLSGEYSVRDLMNDRKTNQVDIMTNKDVKLDVLEQGTITLLSK